MPHFATARSTAPALLPLRSEGAGNSRWRHHRRPGRPHQRSTARSGGLVLSAIPVRAKAEAIMHITVLGEFG
jgi:hypothetical protein